MSQLPKKKKSVISRVISGILGALVILMIGLEGYGLFSARSNYGVPNFFGYQFLVIQTDSMDRGPNTYPVDMGIVVKKVAPETLVASTDFYNYDGDVITFYRRLDRRVVTHRIIDIETNANGLVFVCLGDNLNAQTCPDGGCTLSNVDRIPEADVLGKVIDKSPALGTAYNFLSNPVTMLLVVLLPLAVLVVLSALDFIKAVKTKEQPVTATPLLSKEDIEAIKREAREALLNKQKQEEDHHHE